MYLRFFSNSFGNLLVKKNTQKKYLLKFLGRFLPSKRGLKTIGFEKILSVI